ncbi:response regulator [Pseudodesulfovibrio sp. zrk46]|uniref:response regulator n=1 Tax=Pseudodesulfovibrio sp. zrk46 TaxID=2725288 RepID=UPI001448E554|nr:response regulator [Pseudodesulfovibrio sp. zrk46]QJB57087.1 response regulator [Pseudodesulfovibrio sp. zrk46]
MIRLSDIRIRPKLIFLFLVTGILPLMVVGFFGTKLATDSLMEKSFNQLLTVQSIRKGQIEEFFNKCVADVGVLARTERVEKMVNSLESMKEIAGADQRTNLNVNSRAYLEAIEPYARPLKEYAESYGYHDILIMEGNNGHVLFSVAGEDDLGRSLRYGRYRNSGLAMAWRSVMDTGQPALVDFSKYAPSNGLQAAFIAHPIRDASETLIGVIAIQLTSEMITKAVDSRQGMGETGESYLFGISSITRKYELRSDIRTLGDGKYRVGFSFDNPLNYWADAVQAEMAGGHSLYIDSAGKEVLVAYNQLDIPGLDWYLVSKIDEYEVTAPVRATYRTIGTVAGVMLFLIILLAVYFSRSITRPILADMEFAKGISEGKLDMELTVHQKDELGDLAHALNSMARNLQELDWLKRGKEGLDDALRGEHESDELAKRFVSFVTKHMDAQLGALYVLEDEELTLTASYAFTDRSGNFNRIKLGEGMVGQSALEDEIIFFNDVKGDAPAINYGAGEKVPGTFVTIPLSFEGVVLGVLLLGTVNSVSPLQRRFIEQNIENAAILMNAAKSRQIIRELLEKAHQQQEELRVTNEELEEQAKALKESEAELQAQQEELRVTNEELEEQTKALKDSEAELQAQQEELRVTNEELEERTQALEEQKDEIAKKNNDLVKAQDIVRQKARDLEMASKYKSEFLANMSHELRTPLNSILILSQLFGNNKDGNLTKKQIESANAIHSSGSDLLALINEILDLSKVEAGKIELLVENVSMDSVATDLNRLFKDVAEDKGVGFAIEVEEGLPKTIETDSQRLQQILRNLLTNAFKFTSEGGVSLFVKRPPLELVSDNGIDPAKAVAFAVKDDGIGIPEDKQAAIFNAFQQADGSTSRTYGGTGLGLSISKELTHLLGGTIRLESEEGKGSTFTVILPEEYTEKKADKSVLPEGLLMEEASEEPVNDTAPLTAELAETPEQGRSGKGKDFQSCAPSEEIAQDAGVTLAGKKIPPCDQEYLDDDRENVTPDSRSLLIIEDDRNFAKIMRDFGRERGFLCLVAEDGETGLHFADYYEPSAIILDIGLPGIDGWTVMERLKDNAKLRHIPVHFMSADDSSLDAMRMGAIGYLSKPVSLEKVDDAFSRLEDIISKPVSNLLLVEDDKVQRESIEELIGNGDVKTTSVATGAEAFDELVRGSYDCMILDLGLEDMSGFDLLEKIRLSDRAARVPVIIYTGRDLSREEENKLNRYAESIIIKGVKSPERLLDESALFLHRVEANMPADKQKMLKMVHDKEAVLSGKKVLLVDDDMRNVFALSSVLEERNMEVQIAKNGLECIEKLEKDDSIDCILMDIMMPKMDGYEAMTEIRKQRKYEKLPIIALTAKAMKGDRSKCIEAGASDYLAKPVNTDKLLSMMRVWLY